MTRKKYSDNSRPSFLQELKKDLGPAYENKAQVFKAYVKAKPKRMLTIMFGFVILNITVLLFFTRQYKSKSFHYSDLKISHDTTGSSGSPDIPFTFENYSKMSAIKDTLEYLMNKQALSQDDTLIFLRVAEEIQRLDPGFLKKNKQPK